MPSGAVVPCARLKGTAKKKSVQLPLYVPLFLRLISFKGNSTKKS